MDGETVWAGALRVDGMEEWRQGGTGDGVFDVDEDGDGNGDGHGDGHGGGDVEVRMMDRG